MDGVTPKQGPVSGGTLIAIEGVNLNIGSSILVYLDSQPCQVNLSQVSSSRLTCRTPPASQTGPVSELILIVDDARRPLALPYPYPPDPAILEVRPKWSPVSGGRLLTVHGTNLHTVSQPYIAALDDRGASVGRSPCTVVSQVRHLVPSMIFFQMSSDCWQGQGCL